MKNIKELLEEIRVLEEEKELPHILAIGEWNPETREINYENI